MTLSILASVNDKSCTTRFSENRDFQLSEEQEGELPCVS